MSNLEKYLDSKGVTTLWTRIAKELSAKADVKNVYSKKEVDEIFNNVGATSVDPYIGLRGKKISFLGDSITTFRGYIPSGYAAWYPGGDIDTVEKTWWHRLITETGMTLIRNCAWSGSTVTGDSTSTTNAHAGCSTKRVADLSVNGIAPDIVVVYIGINDFGISGGHAIGEWTGRHLIPAEGDIQTLSESYALMIQKIMNTYPKAKVYCCTLPECNRSDYDQIEPSAYPVQNRNGQYLMDYNETIRTVAKALGATVIDLHAAGINYWNLDLYTIDSIHPNFDGATLIKEKVKHALMCDFKTVREDGTPNINWIDYTTIANTWLDYATGSENSLNGWLTTNYIKIPDNATRVTGDLSGYNNGKNITTPVAFYDANKNYIGGMSIPTMGSELISVDEKILDNAVYVRMCWETAIATAIPIVFFGYEPFQDFSYIDIGEYSEGVWISYTDGSEQTLNAWRSTDYLEVDKNAESVALTASYFSNGKNITTPVAFYDSGKNYISGCQIPQTSAVGADDFVVDIPSDAKYVRFCWTTEKTTHVTTGKAIQVGTVAPKWMYPLN